MPDVSPLPLVIAFADASLTAVLCPWAMGGVGDSAALPVMSDAAAGSRVALGIALSDCSARH